MGSVAGINPIWSAEDRRAVRHQFVDPATHQPRPFRRRRCAAAAVERPTLPVLAAVRRVRTDAAGRRHRAPDYGIEAG